MGWTRPIEERMLGRRGCELMSDLEDSWQEFPGMWMLFLLAVSICRHRSSLNLDLPPSLHPVDHQPS